MEIKIGDFGFGLNQFIKINNKHEFHFSFVLISCFRFCSRTELVGFVSGSSSSTMRMVVEIVSNHRSHTAFQCFNTVMKFSQ